MKEAQYNCCWNANYCNESCQQAHWPEHMKNCVQVRQSSTPAAHDGGPITPSQSHPVPPGSATPTNDSQSFVFTAPQPSRPNSTSGGHIIMPHNTSPATMATQPSPRDIGGASENMLQYAESAHADHRGDHTGLAKAMTRIEHVPNDTAILTNAHHQQASQHMLLLQQAAAVQHGSLQHQQQQPPPSVTATPGQLQSRAGHLPAKNSVISGAGSALIRGHPTSLYQPLMAQVVDGATRDSSPHCLPTSIPRPTTPGSPVASEHPSVHNPPGFSWPYQQPVIISTTDGYPMPLIQTTGNNQQHQSFFKAF